MEIPFCAYRARTSERASVCVCDDSQNTVYRIVYVEMRLNKHTDKTFLSFYLDRTIVNSLTYTDTHSEREREWYINREAHT